jgi:FAD-dependent oxidoreductase family protein
VQPYQIPYRVVLPKKTEAENVLVPVSFSASHVAFSSLRMEPQWMIIGHATGVAAALAIKQKIAVQDVAIAELQKILRSEGGVFEHGLEYQQKALAAIREKFAPVVRKGPTPWARPEPASR